MKPSIDVVQTITLSTPLYISGEFYFLHINCDLIIDQYIIKEIGIYHYKSDKPL